MKWEITLTNRDKLHNDEASRAVFDEYDRDLTALYDNQERFNNHLAHYGFEMDSVREGLVM
jgi:hypothetical protein